MCIVLRQHVIQLTMQQLRDDMRPGDAEAADPSGKGNWWLMKHNNFTVLNKELRQKEMYKSRTLTQHLLMEMPYNPV